MSSKNGSPGVRVRGKDKSHKYGPGIRRRLASATICMINVDADAVTLIIINLMFVDLFG